MQSSILPGPVETEKREFTAADAGTYFDSHRGQFIPAAVIQFAYDLGWRGADEVTQMIEAWNALLSVGVQVGPLDDLDHRLADLEHYIEISEEAESWIEDHTIIPEGYFWGYLDYDGSWGLWENESEEEDE